LHSKKLYHTPNAYIYAANDQAAAEADQWIQETNKYLTRKHGRPWLKGIVLVMEPGDPPVAADLEEELALERDPTVTPTKPRKMRTLEEYRKKLADDGVPEAPYVRGITIPMPRSKVRALGFTTADAPWALAAPSHALAVECGIPVNAGLMRKKFPSLVKTDEQARQIAERTRERGAKPFEITRGLTLGIVWVEQQSDWTDEQRWDAIRDVIRYTYRVNWLPQPKDEDLEW
jgi:hypothetical protein